ncbi:JAB domain-containing protein [Pandoraea terrae]|uniref:JAB domain-containing protein n=1 Tax=Pandoraea terrae TaxID=1537710 RepID=A0A5E4RA04_9BURK|nr:DNA repair protein RadC [Pandoraea terrae]VVD59581.1 JAB domain-containing protein [Pandoraea terrae]
MSIMEWPAAERPREKMVLRGAGGLSDAELLAIFLRSGPRGSNAVDLGRALLTRFGSLAELLNAPMERFRDVRGMGTAKCLQFQAALEVSRRALAEAMASRDALSSPDAVHAYLRLSLAHRTRECFACLFLNVRNEVIDTQILFEGTLTETSVYPREVVAEALRQHAAAVIVAHNHPSGNPQPSVADLQLTRRLGEALAMLDIRLLDHVIVGRSGVYSLAAHGQM